MTRDTAKASLPTLDLRRFDAQGDERRRFLQELRDAARTYGFLLSRRPRRRRQADPDVLGALPTVLRAARARQARHRDGQLAAFSRLQPRRASSTRAASRTGASKSTSAPERPALPLDRTAPPWTRLQGPNQWPAALPGVQARSARLSGDGHGARDSGAAARSPPRSSSPKTYSSRSTRPRPTSSSRSSAIPAAPPDESDQGVGAHKDSGFVTILLQDKVAGLQVEGEDGWIDAPPVPGTFVVNIGEILEIASNGYLRANVHRVVSPPAGDDRLSVAFFLGARLDADSPAARAAAASGGAGARPDAGPAQSALPRSRPQLPEEPAALASRRRAPPSRRSSRSRRRQARTGLRLLTPSLRHSQETTFMATDSKRFETLALHGGSYRADPVSGAVAVPIYQTTSYQFQDTGHASRLFALEELGNIYTRVQNPTWDALEQRIAALEGGAAALAVASGQTASAYSVLNLAQAGDNIVSSTDLYGGTWTLFAQTLKQFGIETRFVDPTDPESVPPRDRREDARLLRGDPAQSEAQRLPDQGGRRHRPLARRAADRRQHRDAADRAAVRAWRGGRRLFGDQIYRRPRHLDRRPDHRRRQFPVGGARRALSAAHPARRGLSRRDLDRGRQAARADRLCPARARQAAARPRRGALAVQRLPVPARARDAAAAAAPAQRERDRGRRTSSKTQPTSSHVIFPGLQTRRVPPSRRRLSQGRLRRRWSASS